MIHDTSSPHYLLSRQTALCQANLEPIMATPILPVPRFGPHGGKTALPVHSTTLYSRGQCAAMLIGGPALVFGLVSASGRTDAVFHSVTERGVRVSLPEPIRAV